MNARHLGLLAAGLSILAAGCAGHASKQDTREAYEAQTITIDRAVEMPKSIHYVSAGQSWGNAVAVGAGGLIGGLVGGAISAASGPDASLQAYFDQNRIDVGQIFAGEMRDALARNQFAVAEARSGNSLRLAVTDYGFHTSEMFGGDMRLVMTVKAELFNPQGKRIWSKKSGGNHVKLPELSLNQHLADPARLAEAFRLMSADMAERLQQDLRREHAQLVDARRSYVAQTKPAEPAIVPATFVAPASTPAMMTDAVPAPTPVEPAPAAANSGGTRHRIEPTGSGIPPVAVTPPTVAAVATTAAPVSAGGAPAGASLRKWPTPRGEIVGTLSTPASVDPASRLENQDGAWYYVSTPDAKGWIAAKDLRAP